MSLKDNFNQAVKELLRKDVIVGNDPPKNAPKKSELDKYLEPEPAQKLAEAAAEPAKPQTAAPTASRSESESKQEEAASAQENTPDVPTSSGSADFSDTDLSQAGAPVRPFTPNASQAAAAGAASPFQFTKPAGTQPFSLNSQPQPTPKNIYSQGSSPSYSAGGYGGAGAPPKPPKSGPQFAGGQPDTPYYETEETTVISRNTVIDGNIRSFANITIDGSVKGDVKITKNISITGKVIGDIECNNSVMTGASMQGNVSSKGQVQVDRDSLLLGDISAQYLDLNGKIKGNIDVGGKAEFKTDAVILGNITASTITVLDGATIQGYVNTTFLQESSSSIFPEAISVTE